MFTNSSCRDIANYATPELEVVMVEAERGFLGSGYGDEGDAGEIPGTNDNGEF